MSPLGHTVTAFSLSAAYLRCNKITWEEGISTLSNVLMSGHIERENHAVFVSLVSLGILLGARGPDRLEISSFNRRTKIRRSVIPHRTFTHWPPLWVVMTWGCWSVEAATQDIYLYFLSSVGIGFCAAGLLHLVMDIMTPTGIPLLLPFGSRSSLNFYNTALPGKIFTGEWICILLFVSICQFLPKFTG